MTLHDPPSSKSLGPYINVSYMCSGARAVCVQSADGQDMSMASGTVVRGFPVEATAFMGLAVITGHALVDTGAQSGVVGLHHWQ